MDNLIVLQIIAALGLLASVVSWIRDISAYHIYQEEAPDEADVDRRYQAIIDYDKRRRHATWILIFALVCVVMANGTMWLWRGAFFFDHATTTFSGLALIWPTKNAVVNIYKLITK